ncbi:MAG: hypothetical protein HKN94_06805 [Acidimicrobiales bacterium]|nr:hypothetical protein [Acidimicrobiales bacterium]RZV46241.1 MAG: hypothetical protein EX269_07825 [Acidimicrobiales bacterium]
MHDITDLERRGIPGVFVASAPFADAAQSQGDRLGFHPAHVIVEHPIQDRTDEEMHAIADAAVDQLVSSITK